MFALVENVRELYQQVILDHNKNPRDYGAMENPDGFAHGNNPLCGDTIDIYLRITEGIMEAVQFEGAGCAICTSSPYDDGSFGKIRSRSHRFV